MMAFFRANVVAARETLSDFLVLESKNRIRHGARPPYHSDGKRPTDADAIQTTGSNIFMLALDHLKKHRSVMISLPVSGETNTTLEGVAHRRSVDLIDVAFLPGQLPLKRLDLNGTCRLVFEEDGRTYRLRTKIVEIIDDEKLLLKAIEKSLQYGEREFFRVNANFSVKYRLITDDPDVRTRQFDGPMNLSGSGLLLPLTEGVRDGQKFSLTMILCQDPLKVVRCIAQVVRTCPLANGLKGAGMQFTDIEPPDRDTLIAFCMAAQRLELRNKVQTKDLT
jgi:c-di-GMP-binding flagellar brake protein YcgR